MKTLLEWIKDWEGNKRCFTIIAEKTDTTIEFDSTGMNFSRSRDGLNMLWKYKLVQQPVPFMEAVKAYAEGKTIRCECESVGKRTYKYVGISNSPLEDNNGTAISCKEILEGQWFVEND